MPKATVNLANPLIHNIGPLTERKPPSTIDMKLPAGTKLISADNHWEIYDDIFFEHFPTHLKDKAPRVWFDKFWRIGYRGKIEALPIGEKTQRTIPRTNGPGLYKPDLRYQHLDAEGVQEEMVFPKMFYRSDGTTTIVATQEELNALSGGWFDSPAYFGLLTAPSVDQVPLGVPSTPPYAPNGILLPALSGVG